MYVWCHSKSGQSLNSTRLEMSKEELLEMFKVCQCVGEGEGEMMVEG